MINVIIKRSCEILFYPWKVNFEFATSKINNFCRAASADYDKTLKQVNKNDSIVRLLLRKLMSGDLLKVLTYAAVNGIICIFY